MGRLGMELCVDRMLPAVNRGSEAVCFASPWQTSLFIIENVACECTSSIKDACRHDHREKLHDAKELLLAGTSPSTEL